jgi:hypothetical protein
MRKEKEKLLTKNKTWVTALKPYFTGLKPCFTKKVNK